MAVDFWVVAVDLRVVAIDQWVVAVYQRVVALDSITTVVVVAVGLPS